jgi:hypothetical protein
VTGLGVTPDLWGGHFHPKKVCHFSNGSKQLTDANLSSRYQGLYLDHRTLFFVFLTKKTEG